MSPTKEERLEDASALCGEFTSFYLPLSNAKFVALVHKKWMPELELRLRQIGFRFIRVAPRGYFRVVTVIDMYRG